MPLRRRSETGTLWRAQAQLLADDGGNSVRVRIPGMEAGSDVHDVPRHVVPAGTVVGERFHIRCSLDPDAFAVEPALEGERQCQ